MEVINTTLDKYCQMLYFWKNQPTTLGKLSNKELESIVKFINKYPEGLLNGLKKLVYLEAVKYILDWRNNDISKSHAIIESRMLTRAEEKADKLTIIIFNTFKETIRKSSEKRILKHV